MSISKSNARSIMKKKRSELTDTDIPELSRRICNNIFDNNIINSDTGNVLLFASYNKEPDTYILFGMIKERYSDINIFYPKVSDDGINMEFYSADECKKLIPGYMGIAEPSPDKDKMYTGSNYLQDSKSVIILPGLAFDMRGYRAGYGGGFYDRYLDSHTGLVKAAIGYDFQIIDNGYIDNDEHDIPADYIVTDKRVIKIK